MGHRLSHDFIAACFDILARSPSKYALQVGSLLKFLKRETNAIPKYYLNSVGMSELETKAMVRDKAICFSGVDEWMFAARNFDLAFGMRMHGTMVALQAGVPSVLITHDRRTVELAKTMDIPRISLEEFIANMDAGPGFLYACSQEGLPGYFRRRQKLAARMATYLNRSGLQPSVAFSDYLGKINLEDH
jgi:hypothetical protein